MSNKLNTAVILLACICFVTYVNTRNIEHWEKRHRRQTLGSVGRVFPPSGSQRLNNERCANGCKCYGNREIHCTFRLLTEIPAELPLKVVKINLAYNKIKRIPTTALAEAGSTLRFLFLQSNEIRSIHGGEFGSLRELEVLRLSWNEISGVFKLSFDNLTSLSRLHLDHNKITFIHPEAFIGLTNLNLVQLEGNKLSKLHADNFATVRFNNYFSFSHIQYLYLSHNDLEVLPQALLPGITSLQQVYLHGNPWECSCQLQWLHQWMRESNKYRCKRSIFRHDTEPECAICASPVHLQGRKILQVPFDNITCTPPKSDKHQKGAVTETFPDDPSHMELQNEATLFRHGARSKESMTMRLDSPISSLLLMHCNASREPETDTNIETTANLTYLAEIELMMTCSIDYPVDATRLDDILRPYLNAALNFSSRSPSSTSFGEHTDYKVKIQGDPTAALNPRGSGLRIIAASVLEASETIKSSSFTITIASNRFRPENRKLVLLFRNRVNILPSKIENSKGHPWTMLIDPYPSQQETRIAMERRTVVLRCRAMGSPRPTLSWVMPNERVIRAGQRTGRFRVTGGGRLVVRRTKLDDAGVYYCMSQSATKSEVAEDIAPVRLFVVPASDTSIERSRQDSAVIGKSWKADCVVNAVPDATIAWKTPTERLLINNSSSPNGDTIVENNSIMIREIKTNHIGMYSCIAANRMGAVTLPIYLDAMENQVIEENTIDDDDDYYVFDDLQLDFVVTPDMVDVVPASKSTQPIFTTPTTKNTISASSRALLPKSTTDEVMDTSTAKVVEPTQQPETVNSALSTSTLISIKTATTTTTPVSTTTSKHLKTTHTNTTVLKSVTESDIFPSTSQILPVTVGISNMVTASPHKTTIFPMATVRNISTTITASTTETIDLTTTNDQTKNPLNEEHPDVSKIKTIGLKEQTNKLVLTSPTTTSEEMTETKTTTMTPSVPVTLPMFPSISNAPANASIKPSVVDYSLPTTYTNFTKAIELPAQISDKIWDIKHATIDPAPSSDLSVIMHPQVRNLKPTSASYETTSMVTAKKANLTMVSEMTFSVVPNVEPTSNSNLGSRINVTSTTDMLFDIGKVLLISNETTQSNNILLDQSTQSIKMPIAITVPSRSSPSISVENVTEYNTAEGAHSGEIPLLDGFLGTERPSTSRPKTQLNSIRSDREENATQASGLSSSQASGAGSPQMPSERQHDGADEIFIKPGIIEQSASALNGETEIERDSGNITSNHDSGTEGVFSHELDSDYSPDFVRPPIVAPSKNISKIVREAPEPQLPNHNIYEEIKAVKGIGKINAVEEKNTSSGNNKDGTQKYTKDFENKIEHQSRKETVQYHPDELTVNYGDSLEIQCPFSGDGERVVTWSFEHHVTNDGIFKDDIASIATVKRDTSSLFISKVGMMHNGTFSCQFNNRSRNFVHQTKILIHTEPPIIINPTVRRLSVDFGASVKITCEAEGIPKPEVRWSWPESVATKTEAEASVKTATANVYTRPDNVLHIENATQNVGVMFLCGASNAVGHTLHELHVDVRTTQPVQSAKSHRVITVYENEDLMLNCAASGVPPPRMLWILPDDRQLTRNYYGDEGILILQNDSLVFQNISRRSNGRYLCVGRNVAGESTTQIRLRVRAKDPDDEGGSIAKTTRSPAVVTSSSGSKTIFLNEDIYRYTVRGKVGETAILNCRTPPDAQKSRNKWSRFSGSLEWRLPDGERAAFPLPIPSWRHNPLYNGTLRIRKLQIDDNGTYLCVASNKNGLVRTVVTLSVKVEAPMIRQRLSQSLTVSRNRLTGADCSTRAGKPKPRVHWETPSGRAYSSGSWGNGFYVKPNGRLVIRSMALSFAGRWRCVASNVAGNATRIVNFKVPPFAPRIKRSRSRMRYAKVGHTARMECSALAVPKASFYWILPNGIKMIQNKAMLSSHHSKPKVVLLDSGTLVINRAKTSDNGFYKCYARNMMGSAVKTLKLRVYH